MVIYKVVKSSSRQTISHTVTPTLGLSKKKGYHTSGNFHNDHDVKLKKTIMAVQPPAIIPEACSGSSILS